MRSDAPGAPRGDSPRPDEAKAVSQLRGWALALIEDMLAAVCTTDCRRVVEANTPATIHEALVVEVMRGVVREVADARGLPCRTGRLFDDALNPLLSDPRMRRVTASVAGGTRAAGALEQSDRSHRWTLDGLPVEVIGSLYEGLIAHEIVWDTAGTLTLARTRGRKRSGSFYTPPGITREVVSRALAPAFARVADLPDDERATAILALRLCDPAMGAGAFLVEVARQLAVRLASCDAGEVSESAALRQVVSHCVFGCDTSPVAVAVAQASLWLLVGDPTYPLESAGPGLRTGDALIGLLHEELTKISRAPTEASCQLELPVFGAQDRLRAAADHLVGRSLTPAARRRRSPPEQLVDEARRIFDGAAPDEAAVARARSVAAFHWPLDMAPAATDRGFDAVIGNPPWIAFAGRAAQALDPAIRDHFSRSYEAWRGYPTLHGLFVERAARLAPHGVVALVVPSPLADLDGYRAVRLALSRRHTVREPLLEFGQDAFDEVVQPCIALVADPDSVPRPTDREWRLEERQRANGIAARVAPPEILARFRGTSTLPSEVFREMGFQTTSTVTRTMLLRADEPDQWHRVPLLEGRNVREFFVGSPRLFLAADPERLHAARARLRPVAEYARVDFVVRQTASVPIAARHSGLPFRNTLLAGFARAELPVALLVGLLNSALYRALHLAARRDARQAVFPQVKIAHLRELPAPPGGGGRERVAALASELEASAIANGGRADQPLRSALDEAVFDLFEVPVKDRESVLTFLAERAGPLGYAR